MAIEPPTDSGDDEPTAAAPATADASVPSDAGPSSRSGARSDRPSDERLRSADGHLAAALALLLDPTAAPRHSAIHLLRAWTCLRAEPWPAPTTAADAFDRLPDAIEQGRWHWLDHGDRENAAALLRDLVTAEHEGEAAPPLARGPLLEHAQWLRARIRAELCRSPANSCRRRWRWLAALVILLPAAVYLAVSAVRGTATPWYGRYYHNGDFRGDPWLRRDPGIAFHWGAAGPFEGFRSDHFSARWDTCLVVAQPTGAVFLVASDDGARLAVDGADLIDELDRGGFGSASAHVELGAGVHHLRLEYREQGGEARVGLTASLAGEVPRPLPTELLRAPPVPLDEEAPCRGVAR